MTQVRDDKDLRNDGVPTRPGVFLSLGRPLPRLRVLAALWAVALVFPMFFPLNSYAFGPDDRGGPSGNGPGGGSQGGGPPGGGQGPGGPQGGPQGGPAGAPGGGHDFGERRGERGNGERGFDGGGRAERGRQSFRSMWNEEGFFDDNLGKQDHQKALAGVRSGRFRSLKEIMDRVGVPSSSRIVSVDLLDQSGLDVYSIIVRDTAGRLERMTINAATGERIN